MHSSADRNTVATVAFSISVCTAHVEWCEAWYNTMHFVLRSCTSRSNHVHRTISRMEQQCWWTIAVHPLSLSCWYNLHMMYIQLHDFDVDSAPVNGPCTVNQFNTFELGFAIYFPCHVKDQASPPLFSYQGTAPWRPPQKDLQDTQSRKPGPLAGTSRPTGCGAGYQRLK